MSTVDTPVDLRTRRLELRLTASEVASALGVHTATVLRWERGVRLPGADVVAGLAQALETERDAVAAFFSAHRSPAAPATRVRATGLRALRRERGCTAGEVASSLGVPVATVFNWESGRAGLPLDLLPRLQTVLGMTGPGGADQLVALLRRRREPVPTRRSPVRSARRSRGWSQDRLAAEVGVSRHLVGRWERGDAPQIGHQRHLARALGLDLAVVAGWFGTPPPHGLRPVCWQPGDLPRVLTDLRRWSDLRQSDVARYCGRSPATVRAWETGRALPPRSQRDRLAALYRLPAGALDATLPGGTP
ncbi:helix-turn-helix transcriptional regulator [Nocardioides sp. C4-1]|uniref:helix-turn-helix transcriptional regulator n=1 Tax=Nocardioides sp. C4-1 TaxID=3151851 RepID=UPI003265F323